MNSYLLLFISIGLSSFAQIFQKMATGYKLWGWKNIAFISMSGGLYFISFVTYYLVLKNLPLNKAAPLLTIGSTVLIVILSFLLFREIITLKQFIGIILGCVAIWLI